MYLTSSDINEQGYINEICGKRGTESNNIGMPLRSVQITIHEAPEQARSFVLIMDDPDSVDFCGFVWDHWLVANLHQTILPQNVSQEDDSLIQGKNSWNEYCYGGPAPHQGTHKYVFTVYALDIDLNLETGFSRNDIDKLLNEQTPHILAKAVLTGLYDS